MLINKREDYYKLISELNDDSLYSESDRVAAMRELCLTDLYFLLRYGCSRADVDNDWLFERAREVQSTPDNMLDLWFREGYKSTWITFALTIQDILNNPEITIGIFSHTRPMAKGFLRQIKREFELNENLKYWFSDILYQNPSKEAIKWSEDDGIIVKRKTNPKESTVEGWGVVDGQPTGKHFNLLIYDDIVTQGSVSTPDQIAKTTDSLALSYNLGAHGGKRRFIGTRYHFNDTYRVLIDRGTVIPRVYAVTEDGSSTGKPVFLTQERINEKRRDMGSFVFSAQMLQNPVADSSQGFQREWLQFYDNESPRHINWYLLVDAANAQRKTSDYTSMWAVGCASDGNIYAIPEVRDRLNLTQRCSRLLELHRKYKPTQVRYERYGMGGDIAYIMTEQEKQGYRFDIIEVAGNQVSKNDRIKRLVPLYENRKIYHPRERFVTDYEGKARDLIHDYIEEEYAAFPVPLHDDMLDSLARIQETEGKSYNSGKSIKLQLTYPSESEHVYTPRTDRRSY
jgi:phage terminase large subunit-like protein